MSGPEVVLQIERIVPGGAGMGRLPDGKVCFVHGVLPEEKVLVRIVRSKKSHAEAELQKVQEASPLRIKPRCAIFGACGGCAYQHVNIDMQREWKTSHVTEILRRIGRFPNAPVAPILASPLSWGYRNRIALHTDGRHTGFHHRGSHHIVDARRCELASESVNDQLTEFRTIKHPSPGRLTLREAVEAGFSQVNAGAAALLRNVVIEMAGEGGLLIDAYCGSGFFAKALGGRFEESLGIEWSEASVARARAEARPGEVYVAGSVDALLGGILAERRTGDVVLVADPPAEGLGRDTRRAILEYPPRRMVYVSCDPSTFARDAAELHTRYTLERVQPVDMFPQTAEIELAALLVRRDEGV